MKLPKFLVRYLNVRRYKKQKKYEKTTEYKLEQLYYDVERQSNLIKSLNSEVNSLTQKEAQKELKAIKEYKDKTDPFKADKWKVVYDTKGQVSTVYFNGQQLHGVQQFSIDFDALTEGQTPRFSYEGYGSIEIITESE